MASTEETRQKSISRASKEQSSTPLTKADMKVYDEITRSESLPSSFKTLEQRLVEAKKLRGDLPKRGIWENTWEYIMNLVCYAVGLGNIWRFPFVLYEAGGGAFLPIYWIVVAVCGIPTFFMELCLGQYSGLNGSILFGRMCPLFQGLGWSMVLTNFFVAIYYNFLIGLAIRYLWPCFFADLPWVECGEEFESGINCTTLQQEETCRVKDGHVYVFWNNTCTKQKEYCETHQNPCLDLTEPSVGCKTSQMKYLNRTHCKNNTYFSKDPDEQKYIEFETAVDHTSPAEDYYNVQVVGLRGHSTWDTVGSVQADLVGTLAISWFLTFVLTSLGTKSMGKAALVTGFIPYIILTIFLFRGAFLDGAIEGLNFYVKPELDKLLSMDTVKMVIQQIFFSLGVGQGPVITLASYNRFHGEVARDSIAVAIVNGLTSFYAGFVTFMIAGFLAHTVHKPVGDFLKSGNELAFVVYPAATGLMPGSQFWGIFFMLMLTIVGFNTQMATVDSMTCCLLDQWPQLLSVRIFIAGLVCAVGFLAGIPFCLKGGMLWFFVVDHYTTLYIMILILLEVIVAIYIYGIRRFEENYLQMMGSVWITTTWYFRITLCFLTPVLLLVVIIYAHATTSRPSYGWYQFPDYIVGVGWCLYVVLCLPLLFFMVYNTIRIYWSGKSMWALIEPTEDWGPPVDVLEKEMTLSQGKPHDRFLLKLEQLEAERRRSSAARKSESPPPTDASGEGALKSTARTADTQPLYEMSL